MESILIADEDVHLSRSLTEELKNRGYDTDYVLNGLEALDYIEKRPIDLLILDLSTPVRESWQVLKEITYKRMSTRVLAVIAYGDMKNAIDAIRLGAINFISKPYDIDEILISLRSILT